MPFYSPLLDDKVPSHHAEGIQVLSVQPFLGGKLIAAAPSSLFSFPSLRAPAMASCVSPGLSLPLCLF